MPDQINKKSKLKLGKKTDTEYKYSTKIDFKEELSVQISRLMQEKKAKDELEEQIVELKKAASKFPNKSKNIQYYYTIGKILAFIDNKSFKSIGPFSIFRQIADEIPEILPDLDKKRIVDHLMMMYRISKIKREFITKARWDQWYEITKFNITITNQNVLYKLLSACASGISGKTLRRKVKTLFKLN